MIAYILNTLRALRDSDSAQDAFEYLLVIGGVSVAVILAMTTVGFDSMVGAVIDGVCAAFDTVGITVGDCTT